MYGRPNDLVHTARCVVTIRLITTNQPVYRAVCTQLRNTPLLLLCYVFIQQVQCNKRPERGGYLKALN